MHRMRKSYVAVAATLGVALMAAQPATRYP